MRSRSVSLAVLLAGMLAATLTAACSTASAPVADTARVATGTAVGTWSPPSSAASGSAASSPSSTTPQAPPSTRRTAITVVAPPDESGTAAAPPPTTASRPVATTTVTVTPTSKRPSTTAPRTSTTKAAPTTSKHTTPRTSSPATRSASTASTGHAKAGHGSLAGRVVVIDPGHNGSNAAHPEIIHQQVPAGFGEYKNCNTTGTETNAGYPEYRFNWKVALALRDALQAKGITVIMTRESDDGVGPCVNERAAIGNNADADAVVSIHGDGESAGIKGFYVMTAERAPAGAAMADRSMALAKRIRDGLLGANFPSSNALGENGLWTRSDLAGLNLSKRPTVMIECGNMRNATEAALMSSSDGQQRYANGIAAGVIAYLGG